MSAAYVHISDSCQTLALQGPVEVSVLVFVVRSQRLWSQGEGGPGFQQAHAQLIVFMSAREGGIKPSYAGEEFCLERHIATEEVAIAKTVTRLAHSMKFVLPPGAHEATQVTDTSLHDRHVWTYDYQIRMLGMSPDVCHEYRRLWFHVVIQEEQQRSGSRSRTTIARGRRPLVGPLKHDNAQGERRCIGLQHVDRIVTATIGHDDDFA
jgi:hypothetical protein